jgi:hypothetical protein
MKKQPKKLVLKKETLRDLTVQRGGEVKGGRNKTFFICTFSCAKGCYTYHCG